MNIAYGGAADLPEFRGLSPGEVGRRLVELGCDGVFWKDPQPGWVAGLQGAGLRVYATQGIFVDNADLWQRFPDSRPLRADGTPAPQEEWYRPIRPTHEPVWSLRLAQLGQLAEGAPLDGIWLDFIRWPARWEKRSPQLYDSSFDAETVARFQRETGTDVPATEPEAAAGWILSHALAGWVAWRCALIERFVAEAAERIRRHLPETTVGVFTLPWTGDAALDGTGVAEANRRIAGQDLGRLARHVDVISPMVYHRLCGRPPAWVGAVTGWAGGQQGEAAVWPVVEAIDPPERYPAHEFGQVYGEAQEEGSGSVIVFKLAGLLADPAKRGMGRRI